MRYSDCIFDLYGTLVDIRTDEEMPSLWEKTADLYRRHGAEYEASELYSAYLRLVREMEKADSLLRKDAHEAHPEIPIEKVFQRLYEEKGAICDRELAIETGMAFRSCSLLYIRLYPYVKELLTNLRQNGLRVWLLSNAQAIFTRYELQLLGIDDCFDGIYLSSDYGCKKPDPAFFRILLDERHIAAETAVMIGNDGSCDIRGARDLGISTIYIRSNISPIEDLPDADLVLEEMDLKAVEQWLLVH